MLPLRIIANGLPIYQQIIDQVKRLVVSGQMQPGDELPAIRVLAEQLLVNPNTVARAYLGIVSSRHGSGTFISETTSPLNRKELMKGVIERADALLVESHQLNLDIEDIIKIIQQRHENMGGNK
jgi:GntR family transcriptional regulator